MFVTARDSKVSFGGRRLHVIGVNSTETYKCVSFSMPRERTSTQRKISRAKVLKQQIAFKRTNDSPDRFIIIIIYGKPVC